jgi:hypothetical protein
MKLIYLSLFIVMLNSILMSKFPKGNKFKSNKIYIGQKFIDIETTISFDEKGIHLSFSDVTVEIQSILEKVLELPEITNDGGTSGLLKYKDVIIIHLPDLKELAVGESAFDIQIVYLKDKIFTMYGINAESYEMLKGVKVALMEKQKNNIGSWVKDSKDPLSKYSHFYIQNESFDIQFKNSGLVNFRYGEEDLHKCEIEFEILFFNDGVKNNTDENETLHNADQNLFVLNNKDKYRYYKSYILTIDFAQITSFSFSEKENQLSIHYARLASTFRLVVSVELLNEDDVSKLASYVASVQDRIKNPKFLKFFSIMKMISQLEEINFNNLLNEIPNEISYEMLSPRTKSNTLLSSKPVVSFVKWIGGLKKPKKSTKSNKEEETVVVTKLTEIQGKIEI